MYIFEFDGKPCDDYKVYPVNRPDIPSPVYDISEIKIPGRDGALHIDNHRYEPINIEIELNYIGAEHRWAEIWRKVKKWLSAKNTVLKFSDDSDYFYRVYYVTLDANSRVTPQIGRFKATFACDPYMYLDTGKYPNELDRYQLCLVDDEGNYLTTDSGELLQTTFYSMSIINVYEECHPLYEIIGNGDCEMKINGNLVRAIITDKITIDTELEAAYRDDGEKVSQTIFGNYSHLWLKSGENIIQINKKFDLIIYPNWREL